MDKWLIRPHNTKKRKNREDLEEKVETVANCGDDWCLNGPCHQDASTYFLCRKCTRAAMRLGLDPTRLSCELKTAPQMQKGRPVRTSTDPFDKDAGSGLHSPQTRVIPMSKLKNYVLDHMKKYSELSYDETFKFHQYRLILMQETKWFHTQGDGKPEWFKRCNEDIITEILSRADALRSDDTMEWPQKKLFRCSVNYYKTERHYF